MLTDTGQNDLCAQGASANCADGRGGRDVLCPPYEGQPLLDAQAPEPAPVANTHCNWPQRQLAEVGQTRASSRSGLTAAVWSRRGYRLQLAKLLRRVGRCNLSCVESSKKPHRSRSRRARRESQINHLDCPQQVDFGSFSEWFERYDPQLVDGSTGNSWGFVGLLDQLLERGYVHVFELFDVET